MTVSRTTTSSLGKKATNSIRRCHTRDHDSFLENRISLSFSLALSLFPFPFDRLYRYNQTRGASIKCWTETNRIYSLISATYCVESCKCYSRCYWFFFVCLWANPTSRLAHTFSQNVRIRYQATKMATAFAWQNVERKSTKLPQYLHRCNANEFPKWHQFWRDGIGIQAHRIFCNGWKTEQRHKRVYWILNGQRWKG